MPAVSESTRPKGVVVRYHHLPQREKTLIVALTKMVDQYTSKDYEADDLPYTPGQRTTMPYSALSNAVWTLKDYGVVDVIEYVGRATTFVFTDGALNWAYGLEAS